jgi:hypothetical protein
MKYVYIIMKVILTEQGEEIVPSTSYDGIPQVYANREECHQDLEDGEFLMAVPVQGKDYPLGW